VEEVKIWIPKELKNTAKYHISHPWKNGEGKKIYVFLKAIGLKNTQLKSSKSLLRNQIQILLRVFLIKFQHHKVIGNESPPS
jgi:hypothetical protein